MIAPPSSFGVNAFIVSLDIPGEAKPAVTFAASPKVGNGTPSFCISLTNSSPPGPNVLPNVAIPATLDIVSAIVLPSIPFQEPKLDVMLCGFK